MRASTSPVYYGWFVLGAGAICEMLAQGATSYSAGLFVLPLQAEFQLSRADASSAILILFCGSALVSPFIGRMLDRYSIRRMIALGAAVFAFSLAGIALSPSLWLMALLLFLPAAAGFMTIGPLTAATLASRWFTRRRGLALGIAAVATSGGGLVVVPLLGMAIARYGWRQGLLLEAAVLCVIIVALALLLLRDNPAAAGLQDHEEMRGAAIVAASAAPMRWRDVLSTGAFWVPSLTLASISGTAQAAITLIVPYAVGLGHSVAAAAGLVSAFSVAAAITKVSAGLLADRIEQKLLLAAAALFMTLSWLILSQAADYAFLFSASCLAGVALGCALPTTAALIAGHFGTDRFGSVMGATYLLILICAITAVRATGLIYDRTGSYHAGFVLFAALLACLLAATALFAARGRRA